MFVIVDNSFYTHSGGSQSSHIVHFKVYPAPPCWLVVCIGARALRAVRLCVRVVRAAVLAAVRGCSALIGRVYCRCTVGAGTMAKKLHGPVY